MVPYLVRFISILLTALATGVVFSHVLEKNTKASLAGAGFLQVQQVLLRNFGAAMGLIEGGAFLATLAALLLGYQHQAAFFLTLIGLLCIAAMIGIWAVFINPINQAVNTWTEQSLPTDWMQWRDRWALLHSLRAVLAVVGLSALIVAVLIG